MNIEEIYTMWESDGKIDPMNVIEHTIEIPRLHNKYFRMYSTEGLKLKKYRADFKKLTKLKTEYYRGELDDETLKENNWQPCRLKIMKSDIPQYLESDEEIIESTLRIGYQESIIEYLESIIRQINNRGYQLKTIVDWSKFQMGQ